MEENKDLKSQEYNEVKSKIHDYDDPGNISAREYLTQSVWKMAKGNSGYPELENNLINLFQEQFILFCKKQKDYGPGNINKHGEQGIIIRMSDKMERLYNLYKNDASPNNETLDDTFIDIATYAMIALLVRRGEWPK